VLCAGGKVGDAAVWPKSGRLKTDRLGKTFPLFTMRLLAQYQRLADQYRDQPAPGLAHIAASLCCSERNARLLLQRMQAQGWLRWQPGRGRGKRSALLLQADPDTLRLQHLHQLLAEGRLEAAFDGLPSQGRERLMQSLPAYLGATPAGTLRIPFYRPLHRLDPIQVTRRTESHLISQLCACLTEYDRQQEAIVPALAHHWECSADGRQWMLWLRPGLRFADGRPLSASDVAATLRRVRDTPGPHQALFSHLAHIEGSQLRCELTLTEPDHLLLHRLAHHSAAILPEGDWLRPDFAALPVGAGPFQLVRNNDYRATLRAFDGYYRERALLDEIDIWVVPNGIPLPEADIQFSYRHIAPSHWANLAQLEQGCDFALLNPTRPAFASSAQRLAVGAWLREAVVPLAARLDRPMAEGYLPAWRHLPVVPVEQPVLPKQLKLITYQLESHIELAECLASRLRTAGSKVLVEVLPFPIFAEYGWCADADIAVAGEVVGDDQAFDLYGALGCDAIFRHWADDEARQRLGELTRHIAAEPDAAARSELLEQGFAQVVREGWLLPMRHTRQSVDYAPHLGGVQLARSGWVDFRKLWIQGSTEGH